MKPLLLLTHRPEAMEAEREWVDIARFAGISTDDIDQRRLDLEPLGDVDLDDYSGVLIGGGPFNVSDMDKPDVQLRVEADLLRATTLCIEDDFPYFGLCYGMGVLAQAVGGVVDREFGEPPSAPVISLTDEGRDDPLLARTPARFRAFTGHKEAVSMLPETATVLATSELSPHQLIRVGRNVYAAQFHPELDAESLVARLSAYRHKGYFPAEDFENQAKWAMSVDVGTTSNELIAHFVRRYARD
ncbi:MAG: glutamine amidotransferase [Propionibacterium sp.]|nr:glutamine amidotransferase [Propionibacterium sp.]